jgi:hypothetical protein
MTSRQEIIDALERVTVADYGGHLTIMRFNSNWRPSDREVSGAAANREIGNPQRRGSLGARRRGVRE